ncbi:hypothetical protein MM_2411 [Methanosarcina mazei Go1]|uniref:Uncharacterized protein n=1 Tax=Methanosarcina mazei (strain ATCC BAA-159 / DSM 3647 / Goe1 / Go1 / JCM 11833 / OCM 88) TaxID=192952 RepID=Q8PUC4_METMA|nr:hypothetical protein MM_2411 [Methanosarcina mazei Go1]
MKCLLLKWMRCTLTSVTKKYCWIWIAVDRVGKKFINCSFGIRGTEIHPFATRRTCACIITMILLGLTHLRIEIMINRPCS